MDQMQLPDMAGDFLSINLEASEQPQTQSPSVPTFNSLTQSGNIPINNYVQSRDDPINASIFKPVQQWPPSEPASFSTPQKAQHAAALTPRKAQSEVGTFRDSGYGSRPRQSVGNPSVSGDAAEALSPFQPRLVQNTSFQPSANAGQWQANSSHTRRHRVALSVDGDASRNARRSRTLAGHNANDSRHSIAATDTITTSSRTRNDRLYCEECKIWLKTTSDMRKHTDRHIRPHKCTVPGCKFKRGFGTTNDLDRHIKNVHKNDIPVEADYYLCPFELCKRKKPEAKRWTRLDNFRIHLANVHKVDKRDIAKCCLKRKAQKSNNLAGSPHHAGVSSTALADTTSVGARFDYHAPQTWPLGLNPNTALDLQNRTVMNADALQNFRPELLGSAPTASWPMPSIDSQIGAGDSTGMSLQLNSQWFQNLGLGIHADALASLGRGSNVQTSGSTGPGPHQLSVASRPRNPLPTSRGLLPTNIQTSVSESLASQLAKSTFLPGQEYFRQKNALQENIRGMAGSHQNQRAEPSEATAEEDSEMADGDAMSDIEERSVPDTISLNDYEPISNPNAMDVVSRGTSNSDSNDEESQDTAMTSGNLGSITTHPPGDSSGTATMSSEQFIDHLKKMMDDDRFASIITNLGFQKTEPAPTVVSKTAPSEVEVPVDDVAKKEPKLQQVHTCHEQGCTSSFGSKSALKKHIKRHGKLYSCTFTDCNSRFGSKDDWKRHENSKHINVEYWMCAQPSNKPDSGSTANGPAICGKKFDAGEDFRDHLAQEHSIHGENELDELVCTQKSGISYESWFWCGFCRVDIDAITLLAKDTSGNPAGPAADSNGQSNAITSKAIFRKRSDHIDEHFMGRLPGKNMSGWDRDGHPENMYKKTLAAANDAHAGEAAADCRNGSSSSNQEHHSLPNNSQTSQARQGRQHGQDGQDNAFFRQDPSIGIQWHCCACGGMECMTILDEFCVECGHAHCNFCANETLPAQDSTSHQFCDGGSVLSGVYGGQNS